MNSEKKDSKSKLIEPLVNRPITKKVKTKNTQTADSTDDLDDEDADLEHTCEHCSGIEPKESKLAADETIEPYREIEFTDGHGYYIKTSCNLTSKGRVQVIQFRERTDPEGSKFACTEPSYFDDKEAFMTWLTQLLVTNFDDIPYITIKPVDSSNVKKEEREVQDTMYL
jgi:hypothetical protein